MAGFNYEAGRSNNMLAAEAAGKITIGRWAKRCGVSAAAAVDVMAPCEAHHTGTGRRGKSRLTPVIDRDAEPTAEQLAAMKAFDAAAKAAKSATPRVIDDCNVRYLRFHPYARTRRGSRPDEVIERGVQIKLFADGAIAGTNADGRRTVGWEKLAGLVVAKDGAVLAEKVNALYDDARAIARRISATEAVNA